MILRLLALLLALALASPALAGTLLLDMLDVGQGDAILLRAGGKTVLVDAGDRGAPTVEQLRQLGVERLDLVVASHPHADHIGEMEDVLRAIPVGLYLDSGIPHTTATYERVMQAVEELGVPYRTARAGMALRMGDEATIRVLLPGEAAIRGTRSDLNSNSVVLLVEHEEVRILLTGDAEAPTERALAAMELGPVHVLKVPHHGSAHSSTSPFLASVRPRFALISAGKDNRYGHPAPESLERLAAAGAVIFRTDLSGHLRAVSDGREVDVLEGTLAELGDGVLLLTAEAAPAAPEATPRARARRSRRARHAEGS